MKNVRLRVQDLRVEYPSSRGGWEAVRGASFEVARGEVVGVVGGSGSGKSTTMLAVLALVRGGGRITGGTVILQGEDVLRASDERLREIRGGEIALITQNPRGALNPVVRIGDQIQNVVRAHRAVAGASDAHSRARELLRIVGINDPDRRLRAYAHELSGGMAQRVVIAMALAGEPAVLIADEPTSGLDVTVQAQVLDDLRRACVEVGSSIVIVTQDLGIVAQYADRVYVMHEGRMVEEAGVTEFFSAPRHPRSIALLAAEHASEAQSVQSQDRGKAMDAGEDVLIKVDHLRKTFPIRGSKQVVTACSDVSLTIRRGETLGVIGESGSGKTTLGRCLLRLIEPTAGEITFEGKDIAKLSKRDLQRLRSDMQIVFQEPLDSLNPQLTMETQIGEPLRLHTKLGKAERQVRVGELLDLVGLPRSVGQALPGSLSGGVLQKCSIARAIASEPKLLILDEPTSALPPEAEADIIKLLKRLQERLDLTYVFISHDLSLVRAFCDRVAVMYLSQVVELGGKRDALGNPKHPYSRALLASVLDTDPTARRDPTRLAERLEGEIPSPINLPSACYLASRCRYATARCTREEQALRAIAPGHWVRCWRVAENELFADADEGRPRRGDAVAGTEMTRL